MIDKDGSARLIDYGAISKQRADCAWPGDLFLSFLIFLREKLTVQSAAAILTRSAWFDPQALPEPYRSAAWTMLRTESEKMSFWRLLAEIESYDSAKQGVITHAGDRISHALSAAEAALNVTRKALQDAQQTVHQHWQLAETPAECIENVEIKFSALQTQVEQMAEQLAEERATTAALQTQVEQMAEQLAEERAATAAFEARLAAVYSSTSWTLTKPLRFFSRAARLLSEGAWAWATLKPGSRPRRVARGAVTGLVGFVHKKPRLFVMAKVLLNFLPERITTKLHGVLLRAMFVLPAGLPTSEAPDLSPRAKEFYAMLKTAIGGHQRAE